MPCNKSQQYAAYGRRTPSPWLLRRHSKVAAVLSVMHQGGVVHRLLFLNLSLWVSSAFSADLDVHSAGIWTIESAQGMSRWVVIHNFDEAKAAGIYHIVVIGRRDGDAEWQILHLVRHMAISGEALSRSVIEPLKKGAVYPESFNDAFDIWRKENNGAGGKVCHASVVECM
jgi:post-segregation antitoxin (ccd killing protein)